jgi:hypothetical protein
VAEAQGRSLTIPVVSKTVTSNFVTFRVDDEKNPETWLHLRLSREDLRAALDEMDMLAAGEDTTELALGIADVQD